MSKIVMVCSRNKESLNISSEKIKQCFKMITPPGYTPKEPIIERHSNILVGIFNPNEGIYHLDEKYALIGSLFAKYDSYGEIGTDAPNGCYTLGRYNDNFLEIMTDAGAEYTTWYAMTPELFIASSSQRIIVALLQSFEQNEKAWQYLFSRGGLGLGLSWDRRINHVRNRQHILLDRDNWKLSSTKSELPVQEIKQNASDEEFTNDFKENYSSAIRSIPIDWSKFRIALSGGYDSRFLYLVLKDSNPDIKTVTWTNSQRLKEEGTDAYISKKLTDYYHTDHKIYYLDEGDYQKKYYSNEAILDKFLIASEGRIDHINAYMDGMKMYETLTADNIRGFIRGDQVMGERVNVNITQIEVLKPLAFLSPSDYPDYRNLQLLVDKMDTIWGKQVIPKELEKKTNENLLQWGERLCLDYKTHTLLSALNSIKLTYADTIQPYMSFRIIESLRKLPDHLRVDNKATFKKMVTSMTPPIPFSNAYAMPSVDEVCQANFLDIFYEELNSSYARKLLSNELIDFILAGATKDEDVLILKDRALNPSFCRMAFRAYIIIKMNQMLCADAATFK